MDEHLDKGPGLPKQDPTQSYWQSPPSTIADHRTTETLPGSVDIIIIGSGISGASIAYNLLTEDPSLRIVMLEARQAASGASGRNGGHTKHASYRSFMGNVRAVGTDDAVKIARLEYDCMVAVHEFIQSHGIDCDGKRCDTVDVYYDEQQFENAKQSVEKMKQDVGDVTTVTRYDVFDADQTAKKFLTPGSCGSLVYDAGSLSAYKFTIGVLQRALDMGLNLQTNTPALSIHKKELQFNLWTVDTPRGPITGTRLILATNGYTANLYPKLQGMIVPFRGIVTAQRPGSSMPQTGLDLTYSFVYKTGYDYMISRPKGSKYEGDIVIGGGLTKAPGDGKLEFGNTDDTSIQPIIEGYLTGSLREFFGENWGEDNPEGRVRHCWSGIMGYSADGYPLVGEVPGEQGIFLDASFQGHGMVLCFLCAKAVSHVVLGKDRKDLDKWFPGCFWVNETRMTKRFELHQVPDVAEDEEGER